jgi:hypothetical protein
MASKYHQTTDKEIHDRVRRRYQAVIQQLKELDFTEFCFFSETAQALGLSNGLLGPLGVLAAAPNEVLRIGRDLSANGYYVLLASREYDTYVSPFGLGVKFYTSFTDESCLITANFDSPTINDDQEKLYKVGQPTTVEAAWEQHKARADDMVARGKQRKYPPSFDDFARLAYQEDRYMLRSTSGVMTFVTGLLLVAGCVLGCLLAVTLIFLF